MVIVMILMLIRAKVKKKKELQRGTQILPRLGDHQENLSEIGMKLEGFHQMLQKKTLLS